MTLEEKLFLVNFKEDEESHLVVVDPQVCDEKCPQKVCNKFCPAQVYKWQEQDRRHIINYQECFECGACRIGCPFANIEWRYPRGGFGVSYRYG